MLCSCHCHADKDECFSFLLALLLLPSRDEYYLIFFVLLNKILPQDEAKAKGRQIFHMEKKDK